MENFAGMTTSLNFGTGRGAGAVRPGALVAWPAAAAEASACPPAAPMPPAAAGELAGEAAAPSAGDAAAAADPDSATAAPRVSAADSEPPAVADWGDDCENCCEPADPVPPPHATEDATSPAMTITVRMI